MITKGIEQRNGCVFYYGNPAGYVDQGTAVMDNLFRSDELEEWLAKRSLNVEWTDGVYDRLSSGVSTQIGETVSPLKYCRIWQLKPDVDIMMKFIGYKEMLERFGEPDRVNYSVAYDGQIETNDLEAIWSKFSRKAPTGFTGNHLLAISDIVELYDHTGSEYLYVDRTGFTPTKFTDEHKTGQTPRMTMHM